MPRVPEGQAGRNGVTNRLTEILPFPSILLIERTDGGEYEMTIHAQVSEGDKAGLVGCYLETLDLVERLHRLLLDVIKDEFERLGQLEINAVQALLLFNIGEHEVTAGELKSRGYYQGSNVSYNLKKLVEAGYMHHERCEADRRSVRVRLTDKGIAVREAVKALFFSHAEAMQNKGMIGISTTADVNGHLRRLERFWTDQIRYIY